MLFLAFPEDFIDEARAPEPETQGYAEAPEYVSLEWSELAVKKQVEPKAPLGLEDEQAGCHVRFFIDAAGVVERAEAVPEDECPEELARAAEVAALRWRFYPARVAGTPTASTAVFLLRFGEWESKPKPEPEQVETPASDRGVANHATSADGRDSDPQADPPANPAASAPETELPLVVDRTQLRVKKQVGPAFPPEHRPGSAQCVVELTINTKGRVEKAVAVPHENCPDAFARNSEAAGMKWRFEPFLVDGEPVRVVYQLKINFKAS